MLKKIIFILAVLGMHITPSSAADINNNQGGNIMTEATVNDYEAVKTVLNKYLEAGKQGKSEIMKLAFYKDAIMYNSDKNHIEGGSIQALFDGIDKGEPSPQIEATITTVDIVGNIAYARVEADNWFNSRYTDMFLLLKENNEWKILTKVFYTH